MSITALREAFPHENIQNHFIAWKILSRAIENSVDRDTLRHAPLPAAMIEDVRNVCPMVRIEDEVVWLLFLRALPDEYNVFQQMLERERDKLTRPAAYGVRARLTPRKRGNRRLRLTLLFLFLE